MRICRPQVLVELPDRMFLYIENGEGRLDDGQGYWDLREVITVLIPPHAKHRFVNTSGKPLMMLMLTWDEPEEVTLRKDILVRDSHALPFLAKGHWSYMSKILFVPADGMGPTELLSLAFMAPMTIAAPHAHPPNHEEMWIKLPPAEKTFLFLGSEVQPMPAKVAFLAPVTRTIRVRSSTSRTKLKPGLVKIFMRKSPHGRGRFRLRLRSQQSR